METKKQYIAPELTVVTFKTERGYATSTLQSFRILSNALSPGISSSQEAWTSEENLFGDGWTY